MSPERLNVEEASQMLMHWDQYHLLFQLIADYAYVFQVLPGGKVRTEQASAAFTELTGYDPKRLHWQELVHPDDLPEVTAHIERATSGFPSRCEFRIVTRTGKVMWLRDAMQPVWDASEERVVRLLGVAQDITLRKESTLALEHRLTMEALVASISTRFINVPLSEAPTAVLQALQEVGEFTAVSRIDLVLREATEATAETGTHCYRWQAHDGERSIERESGWALDRFPWLAATLQTGETLTIPDIETAPDAAAAAKRFWRAQQVESALLIPMWLNQRLAGYLGLYAAKGRHWPEEDKRLLRLMAEAFGNMFERKRSDAAQERSERALRRAQAALQQSEAVLGRITSHMMDVVGQLDRDGRFIYISPSVQKSMGYAPFELVGQPVWNYIHPADLEDALAHFNQMLAVGDQTLVMRRLRHAEGHYRWFEVGGGVILDKETGEQNVVFNARDATERRQAEEEIRQLSQFQKAIIENANVLVSVLDQEQRYVVWNKAAERITGYTREEVLGHNRVWQWAYPNEAYRQKAALAFQAVIDGQSQENLVLTLRTKEGEARTLAFYARPLVDAEGEPAGVVNVAFDITERLQATQELSRSEERYRSLFEETPVPLWEEDFSAVKEEMSRLRREGVTDFDAYFRENPDEILRLVAMVRVLDVNRATLELNGVADKTAVLQNLKLPATPKMLSLLRTELMAIAEGQTKIKVEGEARLSTGKLIDARVQWLVVPGYEKSLAKVIVVTEDISEQKQMARERERSLALLEAMIESMADGLIVFNRQGEVMMYNRRLPEMWGAPDEAGEWETAAWLAHVRSQVTAASGEAVRLLPVDQLAEAQSDMWQLADGRIFERHVLPYRAAGEMLGQVWNFRNVTARQRAETAVRRREQFLRLLNEITRAALLRPDLPSMLQEVVDKLCLIFHADTCYLSLWDETEQEPAPAAAQGYLREPYPAATAVTGEDSLTRSVLEENRSIIVHTDVRSQYMSERIRRSSQESTFLASPLRAGEEKLGAVLLGYMETHTFAADELEQIDQAARQVALAIAKMKLLEEAQQHLQEAETLRQAGAAIVTTLDLDEMLTRILEQLERVVPYDSAAIQLLEDGDLIFLRGRGFQGDLVTGTQFSVEEDPLARRVFEKRRPVIIADAREVHDSFLQPPFTHIRGWMGVPLLYQGRFMGRMTLDSVDVDHFKPHHARLAMAFADQVAIALENAGLYQTAVKAAQRQATLYRASHAIAASADLEQLYTAVHHATDQLMSADAFTISLLDEGASMMNHAYLVDQDGRWPPIRAPLSRGLSGLVVRRNKPLLLNEITEQVIAETGARPFGDPDNYTKALIGVPLRLGAKIVGVMTVQSETRHTYDSGDQEILEMLAANVAIAVENIRLVEELEAEVARRTGEIVSERDKNEAILRSVADAIAVVDTDLAIQYVNVAFTTLTGYAPEAVAHQSLLSFLGSPLPGQSEQVLQQCLQNGSIWQGEVTMRRRNGRVYEAAMVLAPMRDADGDLVGFVASHQDISRFKALETARNQFLSNISHQLRTPVANQKLYIQLLQMAEQQQEKQARYLQVLAAQTERLEHLTQDILEMTRLDSGQSVHTWAEIPLGSVLDYLLTRYQARAEEAGITLSVSSVPDHFPPLYGDQSRLTQALNEIVDNALTFTPAGETVTVGAALQTEKGQRWVTISIRDTGPGIAEEEQEKLFDRFFRGQLAESGHVPGTGLGLSIVMEIMRAHGGRIVVESEPGAGSTFTLWLPVASA